MNILKVKGLTKSYDKSQGIFDFDIEINKNDILLLLGPNGAGKTTAFKAMLGLVKSESQQIQVMGRHMIKERTEVLKTVGAMVSKPTFNEYLTGYEYLNMIGSIYDKLSSSRVDEVFDLVNLKTSKHKKISSYSTGMKQRLDLARAIIHQPNLLLLDEPFSGMDIEAKHDLKLLLNEMQNHKDMGVVISSHMTTDFESLANKVIIIYDGLTLFSGEMKAVEDTGLTLDAFYLEKIQVYKKRKV